MKKKILAMLTVCALAASMTACGSSSSDEPAADNAAAAEEEYYDEEESYEGEEGNEDEAYEEEDPAEETASGDFTLLDVSTDMIQTGVYAIDADQNELVFSMFTTPSGTAMASLFIFCPDGTGDVLCGTYSAESEYDENNILWTKLTVSDVYTGNTFNIGFAEADGGLVYIFDKTGTVYDGQYLTADQTVVYMGTAAALIS